MKPATKSAPSRVGETVIYRDANGNGPLHAVIAADLGDGLVNLSALDPSGTWGARTGVPHSADKGAAGRWTEA